MAWRLGPEWVALAVPAPSAVATFDDRGERTLKGVAEAQRLFAVRGGP